MPYADDGYEVFRQILDEDALRSLSEAVAGAVERFRKGDAQVVLTSVALADYMRNKPDRNAGVDLNAVVAEPYILGNVASLDNRFCSVLGLASLWQIAATLLEVSLDEVQYHYASVVRKPAFIGPSLGWHRDYANTFISTDGPYFVRLLIPLQAMSSENGGTGVVPRSHQIHDSEALSREGMPESGEGAIYPDLAPGDVLAIHSKTVHGGGTNRTGTDRDLVTAQFGMRSARLLHTFAGEYLSLASRDAFSPDPTPLSL